MLKDKNVLTVDDSRTIRIFVKALLQSQGAKVTEASGGQQAIELCQTNKYDLILLDLVMPNVDGLQVLRELRQNNQETTVVMLTGSGNIKSAIKAVQEGADGYIEKQDISLDSDYTEFVYGLEQAMERRAGLIAQQQLEQIKGDFYAMVTHDLRSPTSTIHLALQMLQEQDMVGPLNQEQEKIIEVITKATNTLNGLINDYLDFAKIDAGYLRLEWRTSNLPPILQSSVHLAQMQAKAKSQTLILDCPDKLHAVVDARRIKQVFDNLISNAIKYTPRRGKIKVQLSQQQRQVIFKVQDTGYGIPAKQLPSLFAKYHRLPGEATRGIRGSGLGLLIVKEIVEAHHGSVKAESAGKGKGSTFTATIPLRTEMPT